MYFNKERYKQVKRFTLALVQQAIQQETINIIYKAVIKRI